MRTDAVLHALRTAATAQRNMATALEALADVVADGDTPAPCPAAEDAPLLDVRQAAKHLGMSVSWVYRAIEDGRLAVVRIGNRVRLRAADLDAFVARRRMAG